MVLLLEQFHARMSVLAAIEHMLQVFGLQKILELIYALNVVQQILAGKVYCRAIRVYVIC